MNVSLAGGALICEKIDLGCIAISTGFPPFWLHEYFSVLVRKEQSLQRTGRGQSVTQPGNYGATL